MNRNKGLIIALDVTNEEEALRMTSRLRSHLDYVKVGYPLALACGMGIVDKISELVPVICDFKVADIPNTNRLVVEQVFAHGAQGVIVHGFAGHDSVRECVSAAKGKEVYVVSEMSHPGGKEFTQPVAERIVELAVETGATGLIVPATRPERISHFKAMAKDLKIIATGVGAQGGSAGTAIKSGADHVIVGRRLYKAKDPVDEAETIVEEIRLARIK
jgi:orotidine-5'-phosphate decarboxylase